MYSVIDYTIVFHEGQTYDRPRQILHHEKLFCEIWSPISNLSLVVANGFSS